MCDPISIAGGAALAGGTLLSGMGRNQSNRAIAGTAQAELARQRGFRDAASASWNAGLDKIEPGVEGPALKAAQDKRTAYTQGNVTNFSAIPVEGQAGAPKVITDAYDRGAKSATDYGLGYGARTGAMEGYGERLFDRGIGIGRTREDIDKYGNFSRGSASVLPVELEGAQRKGSMLKNIGEVFSGLGNLGLLYGFTRPVTSTVPGGASVLRSAGTIPGIGRIG